METKTKTLSINRMHMMLDEDACSLDLDYEASNDGFSRITIGSIGFSGSQFTLSGPKQAIIEMLQDLIAGLNDEG